MEILDLSATELQAVKKVVAAAGKKYSSACHPEFLATAAVHGSLLPYRILTKCNRVKRDIHNRGVLIVRTNMPQALGDTPTNWNYEASYAPTLEIDFAVILISSLLGHVIGWKTQQNGKLIHDLIPMKGKERAQTGYGSGVNLELHTEDAFHDYRGDFVCFYCLRNDDNVATTVSSIRDINLSSKYKDLLLHKPYTIVPDESHLDSDQRLGDMDEDFLDHFGRGRTVTLLYGHPDWPFIRYDPFFTLKPARDNQALMALAYLQEKINLHTEELALKPGDICLLDNRKVVHGRNAFAAKYDGKDRWLKRISLTSNLNLSRDSWSERDSRIIAERQTVNGPKSVCW